ncbi:MAG TPA: TonB-dependent receptor, partial [Kofleriaceae bacterium]|nr:TonB-dependent receptor [Kofleriaceae bacterium]
VGTPVAGQGSFGVTGADSAMRADYYALTTDLAAKWTSKFNDNKTEVEGVLGWHRDKYDQDALDDSVLDTPSTRAYLFTLGRVGAAGGESMRALEGCRDSGAGLGDPYPAIDNCPVFQYWLDSPGFTIDNLEDRRSALAKVTQRVTAAGSHIIKAGADLEENRTTDLRHFTGGRFFQLINELDQVRVYRYVSPDDPLGTDVCIDSDGEAHRCDYLEREPVTGKTFNWAAFAQDSWQIQPNLTLNAGVRYEEQRLRYADEIRGTTDPFTMESIGKNAIVLRNMWAPRIGLLYDVTREGRSKVYTSWGRFYESIPMALNDFSFSGTTLYGAFFDWGQCTGGGGETPDSTGTAPSPYGCPSVSADDPPAAGSYYRGGTTVVAPGTRAQYMDEIIVGGEYEVLEDLTLGLAYKNRRLGRVLEDVSVDNATTYIIGNPGQFDGDEEAAIEDQIEGLPPGDPERELLESRLAAFRSLRRFDTPRRDYDAVELTAVKRVSRNFFVQGSYTYSRTRGNYPGLLNADTGDALPNASTQYDLAELLANRDGPLPQDRPHYLKLDGYYTFDFEKQGELTAGIRYRAFSGSPNDALAAHYLYGFGESYLLRRGSQGRSPAVHSTDLHLGYARKLARGYELSAFVDIINFFNQEQVAASDELYTFDNANPVVGGDRSDLVWVKAVDDSGLETSQPIGRNIAYGTPLARYTPLFLRLGLRLSF